MTSSAVEVLLHELAGPLGWRRERPAPTWIGTAALTAPLPVSELVQVAFGALAASWSELAERCTATSEPVVIDRGSAELWFGSHARPVGPPFPPSWDPLSITVAVADGGRLRTHANVPAHRAALVRVLDCPPDPGRVRKAAASWDAVQLENAIIAAGGAAAALRTPTAWSRTPAGRALAAEPPVLTEPGGRWSGSTRWDPAPGRPLAGLRVLDLTRVLAGPAATQVLAGLGATVLRVDPPGWDEPGVLPLVMAGKHSARLDASTPRARDRLLALVAGADVVVHGLRAGVLDGFGLGSDRLRSVRPGLIEVSERAYGWSGPWTGRRGFDSLVQFAIGIADEQRRLTGGDEPVPLPVQALDWATGYLMAACVLSGLASRIDHGRGSRWRLSLAGTGRILLRMADLDPPGPDRHSAASRPEPDATDAGVGWSRVPSTTGWIDLAPSPIRVGATGWRHGHVTTELGGDDAVWP